MIKPVEIFRDTIKVIDQTKLPQVVRFEYIYTLKDAIDAIVSLKVRGAPLLGIFAAYAVVQVLRNIDIFDIERVKEIGFSSIDELRRTRPTAVNLFYALDRMEKILNEFHGNCKDKLVESLMDEGKAIDREEGERCQKMAELGVSLLPDRAKVMTICNTGYLATNHIGTALGVIYEGIAQDKIEKVFALETRPVLQGARLTTWELLENNITPILITDNSAAFVMEKEKIDAIFAGADRIARNGDTANKIGTYMLAILAKHHGVPIYIVAPSSSVDPILENGDGMKIEKRNKEEVIAFGGCPVAPKDVDILNYAFDVTPNNLITAIITEEGIFYPPYRFNRKD
ncbi:MAG: S-methyl-5-thioribose-1-phosphate isomerase [Candidatus Hydrothermia bacterium]|nr:S-methyl-5-thioribose-1-phosphate isomerase [Candidatus Hydrothermia bacterium]